MPFYCLSHHCNNCRNLAITFNVALVTIIRKLKIIIKYRLMMIEEACKSLFNVIMKQRRMYFVTFQNGYNWGLSIFSKGERKWEQTLFCKSLWPSLLFVLHLAIKSIQKFCIQINKHCLCRKNYFCWKRNVYRTQKYVFQKLFLRKIKSIIALNHNFHILPWLDVCCSVWRAQIYNGNPCDIHIQTRDILFCNL